MLKKPFLQGSPFIGVPICSNHWFHHHHLQTACLLFPPQQGVLANMNAESGHSSTIHTYSPQVRYAELLVRGPALAVSVPTKLAWMEKCAGTPANDAQTQLDALLEMQLCCSVTGTM